LFPLPPFSPPPCDLWFPKNCHCKAPTAPYIRKHILPRLFAVIDGKKDNVIDFEEYVCAVALFRIGTTEEKIRVLFLMYEPFKGLHLTKESVRKLLVDATVAIQKEDIHVATLELWIQEQMELSECMADMALMQFSAQDGKLELQEFITFVKVEGSVQGLLLQLPDAIDN
jgi:Ca2+-binding EF-hand superfamily protein